MRKEPRDGSRSQVGKAERAPADETSHNPLADLFASREFVVGVITVVLGIILSFVTATVTTRLQLEGARKEQRAAYERQYLVDLQSALKAEFEATEALYRQKVSCTQGAFSTTSWKDCGTAGDFREAAEQVAVLRVRTSDALVRKLALEFDTLCAAVVESDYQTEAELKRQALMAKYREVNDRIGAVLQQL